MRVGPSASAAASLCGRATYVPLDASYELRASHKSLTTSVSSLPTHLHYLAIF